MAAGADPLYLQDHPVGREAPQRCKRTQLRHGEAPVRAAYVPQCPGDGWHHAADPANSVDRRRRGCRAPPSVRRDPRRRRSSPAAPTRRAAPVRTRRGTGTLSACGRARSSISDELECFASAAGLSRPSKRVCHRRAAAKPGFPFTSALRGGHGLRGPGDRGRAAVAPACHTVAGCDNARLPQRRQSLRWWVRRGSNPGPGD